MDEIFEQLTIVYNLCEDKSKDSILSACLGFFIGALSESLPKETVHKMVNMVYAEKDKPHSVSH